MRRTFHMRGVIVSILNEAQHPTDDRKHGKRINKNIKYMFSRTSQCNWNHFDIAARRTMWQGGMQSRYC